MSWSVIEIDESGRVTIRRGGTLTGETEVEPEPEPEPEPKPKLLVWRRCVKIHPNENRNQLFRVEWHSSGNIPEHWYPIESYEQPIETVKRLQEGQKP